MIVHIVLETSSPNYIITPHVRLVLITFVIIHFLLYRYHLIDHLKTIINPFTWNINKPKDIT